MSSSMSGDFSGLSSAGGMSTYLAQKKGLEAKLAGLNAQQDTGSTKTVTGTSGESTEVKSGGKNNEGEKSDIQSRLQDLDNKISAMRTQEMQKQKEADKGKNQTGNAQNPNSQNSNQPNTDNNKSGGVSGSSSMVQQPGQDNGSNGTSMQPGTQQQNRLKTSASS